MCNVHIFFPTIQFRLFCGYYELLSACTRSNRRNKRNNNKIVFESRKHGRCRRRKRAQINILLTDIIGYCKHIDLFITNFRLAFKTHDAVGGLSQQYFDRMGWLQENCEENVALKCLLCYRQMGQKIESHHRERQGSQELAKRHRSYTYICRTNWSDYSSATLRMHWQLHTVYALCVYARAAS